MGSVAWHGWMRGGAFDGLQCDGLPDPPPAMLFAFRCRADCDGHVVDKVADAPPERAVVYTLAEQNERIWLAFYDLGDMTPDDGLELVTTVDDWLAGYTGRFP